MGSMRERSELSWKWVEWDVIDRWLCTLQKVIHLFGDGVCIY